jgi:hypothetical protein
VVGQVIEFHRVVEDGGSGGDTLGSKDVLESGVFGREGGDAVEGVNGVCGRGGNVAEGLEAHVLFI